MKIDLRRGSSDAQMRSSEGTVTPVPRMPESQASRMEGEVKAAPLRDSAAPKIMDWIVSGVMYLLVFLIPIFFLPNVPSILELNKQILLVLLGGIGFLAWIGKLAWEGKIRIKKNFLLVPVVLLLLLFAISTAFSSYRDQSMWGGFGTEGLSLVTIISLVAVFLVINNSFNTRAKVNNLLFALITSSFLASIFLIFQIFGKFIFKNPLIAQNSFNSIGSVYSFSIFIGAILILTAAALLEKLPNWLKIALLVFALVFVFTLIAINFRTALILFLVGMAILLGLAIIVSGSEEKNKVLIVPMVILALVLISTLIGKTGSVVKVQLPVEVGLSQSASFDVLQAQWKDKALLGAGLSNYDLAYLNGKPDEINATNFWSVRFNEASSRFFTLATSVGFLGTAAFLFLAGSVLVYIFSTLVKIFGRKERGVYILIGITAAWIYLTLAFFFYPSNISIDFTWWILTAALATLSAVVFQKREEFISETSSPRVSLLLSFVFVIIIVGFISLIFLDGQKYAAAMAYNSALTGDVQGAKVEELINKLNRVVSLDPSRDLYHRNLSVALFAFLNQKVAEKGLQNLSENDRADISNLYFAAEDQARTAINLNPKNPDNLTQLAQINQNVIGSKDGAELAALEGYKNAVKASPHDPAIYFQIGQVYIAMADLEIAKNAGQQGSQANALPDKAKENLALARQNFEKAVGLKNNYIPAHFMIAIVMQRLGEIDQAITKLQESEKMNPQDPGITFQLGVLYFQTEKYELAKAELENTLKLAENYSNAMYFLGLSYDKLGDKKKALEQFQKVSDLNPDNAEVKKIVANLQNGKKALEGLEQTTGGQSPGGEATQNQNSVNLEQQPVPPETPIENPQPEQQPQPDQQNQEQPNPAPAP